MTTLITIYTYINTYNIYYCSNYTPMFLFMYVRYNFLVILELSM